MDETKTCAVCGRTLGIGFYYACHVCGMGYCYAHSPVKCGHGQEKSRVVPPIPA